MLMKAYPTLHLFWRTNNHLVNIEPNLTINHSKREGIVSHHLKVYWQIEKIICALVRFIDS